MDDLVGSSSRSLSELWNNTESAFGLWYEGTLCPPCRKRDLSDNDAQAIVDRYGPLSISSRLELPDTNFHKSSRHELPRLQHVFKRMRRLREAHMEAVETVEELKKQSSPKEDAASVAPAEIEPDTQDVGEQDTQVAHELNDTLALADTLVVDEVEDVD